MRWRRAWLVAATGALAACADPRPFNGVELRPAEPAPPLRLASATDTFDLAAQRGKAVLVFFGYTNCPDVCPLTLTEWARVRRSIGDAAEDVEWVFVSVDPRRDTPAAADAYAKRFDPAFRGVAGDPAAVARAVAAFKVAASPDAAPDESGAYTVSHSAQTFLVDPEGRLRLLYPYGATDEELAEDLARIVR